MHLSGRNFEKSLDGIWGEVDCDDRSTDLHSKRPTGTQHTGHPFGRRAMRHASTVRITRSTLTLGTPSE